jgi:hypothetical protein
MKAVKELGPLNYLKPRFDHLYRRKNYLANVWVKLPYLPLDLWHEDLFKAIGNIL